MGKTTHFLAGHEPALSGGLVALEPYRDEQHGERAIVLGLITAVSASLGGGFVEGAVDSARAMGFGQPRRSPGR